MQTNIIYQSVRRSNRNLLLASIFCLAFALIVAWLTTVPYFSAKFNEPVKMSEAALATLTDADAPRYFHQIEGEAMFDSGYYEYTEENGVEVSRDAYFGLLIVGEKAVLVRTAQRIDESQTVYIGGLTPPDSIQREIFDDLLREIPELEGVVIPLVLDTIDQTDNWYFGAAALGVILLISIIGLIIFTLRMLHPQRHPLLKRLSRYGDPHQVAKSIEADRILQETPITDKVSITHHWVIHNTSGNTNAAYLDDLVWIYKMVTQHRTNGIPTGKTFKAFLCDAHGHIIEIPGKEAQVNHILAAVATRAPYAILGYSDEIKAAWHQQRQQIIAAVNERKKQLH